MKSGSPVRIAGVDVGEVTDVEPISDRGVARVEMEIFNEGLPIHQDAAIGLGGVADADEPSERAQGVLRGCRYGGRAGRPWPRGVMGSWF